MNKIVHLVHCIDTEGPLKESLNQTFDRLYNIYGIRLKPSRENLIKIQNKKFKFNGLENEISNTFKAGLLNYNDTWSKINKMLTKITNNKFRNKFLDSYGKGWKFNWFIMDHYGFKKNPRNRTLGVHKVWDKYESFYKNKKIKDNFYFHHHPLSMSKSANHCSTHLFNNRPIIYEILSRKLIDKKWFPSVFRPGFHTIRPDSHWFLEQFIPFDYSNQRTNFNNKKINDLSNGRFGDWRRAPLSWSPYHPSHDDYQLKGNCRRLTARCLNLGTRHRLLNLHDVDLAFREAKLNLPVILAFTNHDYRNMENDMEYFYELVKKISNKYNDVKFKWCDAKEAMQSAFEIKNIKSKITQNIKNNQFNLEFEKPIFGPQPYLSFKTVDGQYYHDNFDIHRPFYKWSYTFDEHTMNINKISDFCWAANDKFGNTFIGSISLTQNKKNIKIL